MNLKVIIYHWVKNITAIIAIKFNYMRFLFVLMLLTGHANGQKNSFNNLSDAYKFFQKNISYSNTVLDSNYTGMVLCRFAVAKNGKIGKPAILFAEKKELGEMVLNVIKASDGKWTFPVSQQDSTTIILPAFFMVNTYEKVLSQNANNKVDNYHPSFEAVTTEELLTNVMFLKPLIYMTIYAVKSAAR